MSATLTGKAIVVTGGGGGIGAATARLAAREGARVLVNDIDADKARRVVSDIRGDGGVAEAHVGDISDWQVAHGLVQACIERWDAIDGLVNNAGLHHLATIEEENEQKASRLFHVNVFGTMYCGLAALKAMRKRGSGALVNTTSGADSGITLMGCYAASKGAVSSMTYSWAIDCAGSGVRVNALSPLAGRSPQGYDSGMPGRVQAYCIERGLAPWPTPEPSPEHNAPVTCYLLSDFAKDINGQVVRIDGSRLALSVHPGALHPILQRPEWTVESVAEAFDTTLSVLQQPLGIHTSQGAILMPYAVSYPTEAEKTMTNLSGIDYRLAIAQAEIATQTHP